MGLQVYTGASSVPQGGCLDFHLNDDSGAGINAILVVSDLGTEKEVARFDVCVGAHPSPADPAADRGWPVGFTLDVPLSWPSAVYSADVHPGTPGQSRTVFVVRPAEPGAHARILVSVPFPTFWAYAWAGVPGASLYPSCDPGRARRVSLRRPGISDPGWEAALLEWLTASDFDVDYCSGFDLHDGVIPVGAYQLLVCIGHDEYWTAEMRDTAECFLASGGNIAFLTGNTCWWQFRLEDDGRTMVCYREAAEDPLTGVDDARVTVPWSSAPLDRPENTLTGTSFGRGAAWFGDLAAIASATWTVRFADHWVFEGTGLVDGDSFGAGTIGYETDAAEVVEEDGVPRVTGRDGTPTTFVVLATAELADWGRGGRQYGQSGTATMGVFRVPGGGTVFNAATTGWGGVMADTRDPAIDRITCNVLSRLSGPWPGEHWERIGHAWRIVGLAACDDKLFAVDSDRHLWVRDPVGQKLSWASLGPAPSLCALASPCESTESSGGQRPIGLYAVTGDGRLVWRKPSLDAADWIDIGAAPELAALAANSEGLYGVTAGDDLVFLSHEEIATGAAWSYVGHAHQIVVMTNVNGCLWGVTAEGTLCARLAVRYEIDWTALGTCPAGVTGLAGHAGKLIVSTNSGQLLWRDIPAVAPRQS
ncbi:MULTISPECIES: N,N-dimethylformamidase beta subunit family domain-containing protein [unclassified Frankia]|uniref:N,N-dimethylformamidase beta subunit family domain-containing protein n=1 Tax=unclassified Frankia TaxID=2632575 RepID=UPI002AD2053F|nr:MULTISPECIES: N,N-dimethylformamidase beta subunit family domain-containing protein [unclassified Frankia]